MFLLVTYLLAFDYIIQSLYRILIFYDGLKLKTLTVTMSITHAFENLDFQSRHSLIHFFKLKMSLVMYFESQLQDSSLRESMYIFIMQIFFLSFISPLTPSTLYVIQFNTENQLDIYTTANIIFNKNNKCQRYE